MTVPISLSFSFLSSAHTTATAQTSASKLHRIVAPILNTEKIEITRQQSRIFQKSQVSPHRWAAPASAYVEDTSVVTGALISRSPVSGRVETVHLAMLTG